MAAGWDCPSVMSRKSRSILSFVTLETLVDWSGLDRFTLIGLSQGGATAIAYANRHPERVNNLILYGAFARGLLHRGHAEKERKQFELQRSMILEGWGNDEDSYREFFTTQFIPDGTIDDHRSLNNTQRVAASPEVAARIFDMNIDLNVVDLLPTIRVPTLILHRRGDMRVPMSLGQELAAGIPGSRFVPLDSRNHMLLPNEPATRQMYDAIAAFMGDPPFRGPLPGTATVAERIEKKVAEVERSWMTKVTIIVGAVTGVIIFGLTLWQIL